MAAPGPGVTLQDQFGKYRRYVGNVQRYVIVRMRDWDRDAVPDLVQDTFCIALAELHAADPDVLGWLIGAGSQSLHATRMGAATVSAGGVYPRRGRRAGRHPA